MLHLDCKFAAQKNDDALKDIVVLVIYTITCTLYRKQL